MTDSLARDIGGLEARMDEHDKRFDRIEKQIGEGFTEMREGFAALAATENQRKGAKGLIKAAFAGGGIIAGLIEIGRAIFGGHS